MKKQQRKLIQSRLLVLDNKAKLTVLAYVMLVTMSVTVLNVLIAVLMVRAPLQIGMGFLVILFGAFFVYFSLLYVGLVLSNKVLGPIHRLQIQLKKARLEKDYSQVTWRKDDFLSDLSAEYNLFMRALQEERDGKSAPHLHKQ